MTFIELFVFQTPVYSEHAKFPYVEAFLQEVYRICYVIELGIFRETNKEIKIGGKYWVRNGRLMGIL